jgi:hypothetical protein
LGELDARGEAEFGVDVGEGRDVVGLASGWRFAVMGLVPCRRVDGQYGVADGRQLAAGRGGVHVLLWSCRESNPLLYHGFCLLT